MKRMGIVVVTLWAALACTGDAGPMGPQGPQGMQGPVGPAGSASRADFTGTFGSSGGAVAQLPAEAFAGGKLPVIGCYMSSTGVTWLDVTQTPPFSGDPYCGMSGSGSSTTSVVIVNGIPGWRWYIVAFW